MNYLFQYNAPTVVIGTSSYADVNEVLYSCTSVIAPIC